MITSIFGSIIYVVYAYYRLNYISFSNYTANLGFLGDITNLKCATNLSLHVSPHGDFHPHQPMSLPTIVPLTEICTGISNK